MEFRQSVSFSETRKILKNKLINFRKGIDMPCGSYELFETGIPNKYRMVVQPANYMVELTQKGPLSEGFTSSSAIPLLHNANMRVPFTDYGEIIK